LGGKEKKRGIFMKYNDLINTEKNFDTHKINLDYFLKLPRRAQELIFLCINNRVERHLIHNLSVVDYNYDGEASPIEIIFDVARKILKAEGILNSDIEFVCDRSVGNELNINGKIYVPDFLYEYWVTFEGIEPNAVQYALDNPTATEYKTYKYTNENLKVVVECDGHEFHQKTKQQVKKDNERQLALQMAGYEVIRFSGSQIYNEPFECIKSAYDFIEKKLGEKIEITLNEAKLNEYRERMKRFRNRSEKLD